MKAKKAVKKLRKAEQSLLNVVEQWTDLSSGVRDLLNAAGQSVNRALGLINVGAPSGVAKRAVGGASKGDSVPAKRQHRAPFSAERRRKLSLAAKRRWAAAKLRGAKSLAS